MKKIILAAAVLLCHALTFAQTTKWGYDPAHSKIVFTVTHCGIVDIDGKFTKFDGTVLSDKSDFSDAKIDFNMEVNSITTEESQRDTHLKSPDFFDAEKFPQITFKGKKFTSKGGNKYALTGDLTMHGITKEITLDVLYRGTVEKNPLGSARAGFKITGVLDRTQFGLKWNGALETGGVLVSNEVLLACDIDLMKKL